MTFIWESNFTSAHELNPNTCLDYNFMITTTSPRGLWVHILGVYNMLPVLATRFIEWGQMTTVYKAVSLLEKYEITHGSLTAWYWPFGWWNHFMFMNWSILNTEGKCWGKNYLTQLSFLTQHIGHTAVTVSKCTYWPIINKFVLDIFLVNIQVQH